MSRIFERPVIQNLCCLSDQTLHFLPRPFLSLVSAPCNKNGSAILRDIALGVKGAKRLAVIAEAVSKEKRIEFDLAIFVCKSFRAQGRLVEERAGPCLWAANFPEL